ncbi:MAG: formylglycine-generating enzyme family protein [Bacteroidaceae bacterium]|nr:formylglycine-generating enzyme family protein [Bacteroidaceae bacterium]
MEFEQNGKNVKISYELDKQADVQVAVSTDGGKTYSVPLTHVTGGVGKGVAPGKNTIIWDVLSEREKLVGEKICFRVSAESGKQSFTVKGVTFDMIRVDGGKFTMGATSEQGNDAQSDEKPAHNVTLNSYYIGKTEVTQELWQAVMGSNPSHFKGSKKPVENVSWDDCQKFISKLNSLTGKRFRLPTEAEWEFAARGGTKSRGYKYSGSDNIFSVAWYTDNSGGTTHEVAQKVSNELGIYDMSGNVYEWCQDWYGSYSSSSQTNPTGPASGSYRVYRGGSWSSNAWNCRSANRFKDSPGYGGYILGLRLSLSE